jgi:hypothetical protein
MLAWKIAPALGGELRRLEAGGDHQHHRAEVWRDLPGSRPAAGVVNIVSGAARPARR